MGEEIVEVCFYCSVSATADAVAEVSILGEPMSEVETNFILDRCLITDRERWIQEFNSVPKPSQDAQTMPDSVLFSLEQKTTTSVATTSGEEVRNVEHSSQRLQQCHICGLTLSNMH